MKLNQTIIIILTFLVLFLVGIPYGISTDYCLQQQTNNFTTGDGNCTLTYTGNYSVEIINGTYTGYIYVNYSIPINSTLNNSFWEVKHGVNNNLSNLQALHYNITIPNYCVNDSNTLQLRMYSLTTGDNLNPPTLYGQSYGECFNGINWTIITNISINQSRSVVCFDGTAPTGGVKSFDYNYFTSAGFFNVAKSGYPKNIYEGSCSTVPQYLFHAGLWWEESMYWDVSPINITAPPTNMTNCTEVWYAYYNPSVCMNGTQLKYYEDLNSCNTTMNLPIDNGTTVNCTIDTYCADNICLDPVYANVTCCIVTPQISCSNYTYTLFNDNGTIIETGQMVVFNEAVNSYFYYFNRDVGTYYNKICDGSTRQINVVEEDKMFSVFDWTLIILFIFLLVTIYLGTAIYPLFFGMSALIVAFMTAILWFAGYPPILMGAGILMVLFFTVLAFKLSLRGG